MLITKPTPEQLARAFPEWYESITYRKQTLLRDYYDGYITDNYLDRQLDFLDLEIESYTKRLLSANQRQLDSIDTIMNELPF